MKCFIIFSALCAVALGARLPRLDGRIVGGEQVDILEYPHQVSVRIYDQHICGGSIIDENTILTAGHCVYDMDHSKYSIRAGNTFHNVGTKVDVSRVIENINYDPEATDNDMAILKLKTPLNFSSKIKAIKLQKSGEEVAVGKTAYVSGWGAIREGSEDTPPALRAVDVRVISHAACVEKYGQSMISTHMLCAQTAGHDSCQGDSGGPLVVDDDDSHDSILIGVVSWGYGCARPQYPGVYAKVSDMHDWVISNM